MDEKILKEMASTLRDIKESISAGPISTLRGPVADPGPGFYRGPVADPGPGFGRGPVADPGPGFGRGPVADPGPGFGRGPIADPGPAWPMSYANVDRFRLIRGPVADPAPLHLLDRAKLAQLRIHQLDTAIAETKKLTESFALERDLLKKEYNIKQ